MRADSSAMRSPSRASRPLLSPGAVAGSGGGIWSGDPLSPMPSPPRAPCVSVGPGAGASSNDPPSPMRSGPRAPGVSVGAGGGASSGEATQAGYVRDSDGAGSLSASMGHCNPRIFNSLTRSPVADRRPNRRSSRSGPRSRGLRPERPSERRSRRHARLPPTRPQEAVKYKCTTIGPTPIYRFRSGRHTVSWPQRASAGRWYLRPLRISR